jgi:hypothetical protein
MLEKHEAILVAMPFSDSGKVLVWTAKPKMAKADKKSDGEKGSDKPSEQPVDKAAMKKAWEKARKAQHKALHEGIVKMLKKQKKFKFVSFAAVSAEDGGIPAKKKKAKMDKAEKKITQR